MNVAGASNRTFNAVEGRNLLRPGLERRGRGRNELRPSRLSRRVVLPRDRGAWTAAISPGLKEGK